MVLSVVVWYPTHLWGLKETREEAAVEPRNEQEKHLCVIQKLFQSPGVDARTQMLQPIKSMADDVYVQLSWPRPLPHSHRARLNKRLLKATRRREGMMSPGALDGAKMTGTTGHRPRSPTSVLHLAPSIHLMLQYSCSITLIKCTCSAGILIRDLYFTSRPIFIYF